MSDTKQAVKALREAFGRWWVGSGLRMPREFYIEEAQSDREYIDSGKADDIFTGYYSAERVAEKVGALVLRLEELEKEVSRLRWQQLSDTPPNDFDPSMLPPIPTKGAK